MASFWRWAMAARSRSPHRTNSDSENPRTRTVDQIGDVFGGSTPSRDVPAYWGGDIPWATPSDITGLRGKYLSATQDRITKAGLDSCGALLLPAGTLLVTSRATLGAVAIASTPTATNQGFKSIVCGAETDSSFYYHVFARGLPEMIRRASGTTFLEIPASEFRKLMLPAPPPPEQRCIAEILDTLDDLILCTQRIAEKCRLVKRGLLFELFGDGLGDMSASGRPPAALGANGSGPDISMPPGWTAESMEEAADPAAPICYGIVQSGTFVPDGTQVLTIRDLSGDFRSGLHRTSPDIDARYARSRVRSGDLVISIKGTIGRVAVIPPWYSGNISRDLGRLRLRKSWFPEFVRQYLLSPAGQSQVQQAIVGTTRAEISIFVLKRLVLPRPPLDEQKDIAERLTAADRTIEAEGATLDKLRLLKRGLMEDLITGQTRVTGLLNAGSAV